MYTQSPCTYIHFVPECAGTAYQYFLALVLFCTSYSVGASKYPIGLLATSVLDTRSRVCNWFPRFCMAVPGVLTLSHSFHVLGAALQNP